jgi:hypothetical protein
MIDATWAGGTPPTPAQAAKQAAAARKIRAEKLKASPGAVPAKPASPQSIADNRIWIGAMDAITAGVGRTDVRAGVLRLLATMPHVTVDTATQDGRDELRVTNSDFPPAGYAETMYIDARSGVLLRFVGGVTGKTPSVVVTYAIRRVAAAGVIAGRVPQP